MANRTHDALSRRDLLKLGAVAAPLLSITDLAAPRAAGAQAPKRGGVFRLAGFDPPHFDPHQTPHWWTFIYLSLTHSSLLRHKAGPSVAPGTLPVEGDLAESWERPTETTYVFKLRRGVRWHNKPPVNGRELTADDVVFTYQRALTVKGNPNRAALEEIDKVEAVDRHTVRFTMREPFAWFLDSAALLHILPREAADKDGMYKKPETVIGTGAWMLERYEPNVRLTFVRNPSFYRPGLPYADGVDVRDRHRPRVQAGGLALRPVRLRPRDPDDVPAQRPRGRPPAQAEPAHRGVHVADLDVRRPEARGRAVQRHPGPPRAAHGGEPQDGDRGEPDGCGPRRAEPHRARGAP